MRAGLLSRCSLVFAMSTLAANPGGVVQSQQSFEAAIENASTAPSYVLITVVDDRENTKRSTCTTSNFLLGAIHREYRLGYDKEGVARARGIALENRSHVFHFSNSNALKNIPSSYSEDDLNSIRSKLASLTVEQLREGFSVSGNLHSIYRVQPWERHRAYRDATACVLIERGLSPGHGDVVDRLWLAPQPPNTSLERTRER
jgi:hypothetical protein